MKIAFLGDEYSHTYAASREFCGKKQAECKGFRTAREVAESVASGKCDMCVLPVENSVEGSVTATADVLLDFSLFIRAETTRAIHHGFIVNDGAGLSDIREVYSHPQALAQCARWLADNTEAEQIAVHSTSYALTLLDSKDKAAIAAMPARGQKELFSHIEDYASNATRFLLLSPFAGSKGNRASVIFAAKNRPGGLLDVLKIFEGAGLNMTYIQSRPSKSGLGDYIFFVDFTLPKKGGDKTLEELVALLKADTGFCKFLGRYDHITNSEATNNLWA
ncbi:MAG: ACT domain-containing protein [Clostridia bacterium]|nr:ACT domain-containing protein [Clostridia bacterium]